LAKRTVVELEGAGPGVGRRAVGQRHLKEARALDGEVEGIAGLGVIALEVQALHRGGTRPEPDLDPGGELAVRRARRARRPQRLVEQVLEVGAALLEAGRVHVRQVVGDDVDVQLLRLHPGRGGVQGSDHRYPSLALMRPSRRR
jgi:hypothetical protein